MKGFIEDGLHRIFHNDNVDIKKTLKGEQSGNQLPSKCHRNIISISMMLLDDMIKSIVSSDG